MKELKDNPTPPMTLYIKKGKRYREIKTHCVCGECNVISGSKELAEDCCKQFYCECGNKIDRYVSKCSACRDSNTLKKAEEVGDYCFLYDSMADRYFADEDEAIEYYDDLEPDEPYYPEFIFACEKVEWGGIDIADIVENELCDYHEDAYDDISDVDELVKLVNEWNEKQNIISYFPDYTKKVRIRRQDEE